MLLKQSKNLSELKTAMQILEVPMSALQKLNSKQISVTDALRLIVNAEGTVNFQSIDARVREIFTTKMASTPDMPSVIPLLLYQNRFYLGSHEELTPWL
jgi:hypothetical protein